MKIDTIYNMDCLQGMRQMESNSVDLTVTSPPYDNLRKYNGFSFDFEGIARELYRVTKDGGVVVWIVNDATIDGSETGTSFRQALFFKDCGFNLHDTMIWAKDGGGAIGSNLCYTQNFEYMFIFSKGRPKAVNLIYDKHCKTYTGKYIKGKDFRGHREDKELFYMRREFSRRNNWWVINPSPQNGSTFHPAVFPEQLAADHIKSWSNEGDLILDPFMGSGTTAKMAYLLHRHYIGFEISAEYCKEIEKRLFKEKQQLTLF